MAKKGFIFLSYPVWDIRLDIKVLGGQRVVMREELKVANSLFDIVTSRFSQKSQPSWKRRVRQRGKDLEGIIQTTTPPFPYLAEGTKRRFAVLSKDYKKRTVAGKISPGRVGGSVLARGSRVPRAYARRRRISAGRWHHVIAKKRARPWAKEMQLRLSKDTAIPHTKIKTTRIL